MCSSRFPIVVRNDHVAGPGTGGGNIAKDKTAFMSSVHRATFSWYNASSGNDAKYNTTFRTQKGSGTAWWAVELGEVRTWVTRIRIIISHGMYSVGDRIR